MQVCAMSFTAWEPILVTLWNITTQSAWYLLLHQLYTVVSDYSHMPHHCLLLELMSCHCATWMVNLWTVSTLPYIPHLLTSVPQIDKCCHHALCPQESDHCRDIFMPSHFEPSYQYSVKTIPNTLPFMHCKLHTIWAGYSNAYCCLYTTYKFPLPHAMKFCSLNYWSITTVHLQTTWKTFSHLHHCFNQPDTCRTYSMFTNSKYYHTTTSCTVKFLTNHPMP